MTFLVMLPCFQFLNIHALFSSSKYILRGAIFGGKYVTSDQTIYEFYLFEVKC